MGTKYMLLGIALILCAIAFSVMPSAALLIPVAGGLVLALVGLFKED